MPTVWDHVIAIVIALAYPVRGVMALRGKLKTVSAAELPATRLWIYRAAMTALWISALAVVGVWFAMRRPWNQIGLVPVLGGGLIGILFGLVIVVTVSLRQMRGGVDERQAAALKKRVAGGERMMPHSPEELRWFSLLSISAGLCEELIYRGYYVWYFQAIGLPLLPAAAIACVIFGLAHLYQGLRGVIMTTVVGGFLAGVYLLSGSLFAGMAIHALMDLYAGRMLYEVYRREAAAGAGSSAGVGVEA